MISTLALIAIVQEPPLDLEWFADEPIAAMAMEAHMNCIATAGFERRLDTRTAAEVAREIAAICEEESAELRNALADVFRRKPHLNLTAKGPDEAAAIRVAQANALIGPMITEGRKRK